MIPGLVENPNDAACYWDALLAQLHCTMAAQTFDSVLRGSEGVRLEDHTLTVEVRRPGALPFLNARLMPNILRVTHILFDPDLKIVFIASDVDTLDDADPANAAAVAEGDDPQPGDLEAGDVRPVEQLVEFQPEEDAEDARVSSAPQPYSVLEPHAAPTVSDSAATAFREEHDLPSAEIELGFNDFYIKLKLALRKSALKRLKGAPLSVFLCLALHMKRDGKSNPGIAALVRETGYERAAICEALDELESLRLISKRTCYGAADEYTLRGYAWMGKTPASCLFETQGAGNRKEDKTGR